MVHARMVTSPGHSVATVAQQWDPVEPMQLGFGCGTFRPHVTSGSGSDRLVVYDAGFPDM
jgi:transposase-like protein